MPIENFLRFEGKCYDIGTRLKFRYISEHNGIIEKFINNTMYIRGENGILYDFCMIFTDFKYIIIEIIEPVYYIPKEDTTSDNRTRPAPWDVEIGWIWYIIIMVVGTIFNDRLLIWIVATAIFFLWKSGRLGGQK